MSLATLAVLASHRGTNFQAITDACSSGQLAANVALAISNNSHAQVLQRARNADIGALHLSSVTHPDPASLDQAMLDALISHRVDLVVTAGYLKKLGPLTLRHYHRRVVNIHPSLLPDYGGRGMYGEAIHRAVLANREEQTGVTVHYVDADYDTGEIIAQVRIPVLTNDTPESLAARVLSREHPLLIATLKQLIDALQPLSPTQRP